MTGFCSLTLDEAGPVGVVEARGAVVLVLCKAVRLTRAADAAGAAGHRLDEVKVFASGLDLVRSASGR